MVDSYSTFAVNVVFCNQDKLRLDHFVVVVVFWLIAYGVFIPFHGRLEPSLIRKSLCCLERTALASLPSFACLPDVSFSCGFVVPLI